jgi:hypothetical protein
MGCMLNGKRTAALILTMFTVSGAPVAAPETALKKVSMDSSDPANARKQVKAGAQESGCPR